MDQNTFSQALSKEKIKPCRKEKYWVKRGNLDEASEGSKQKKTKVNESLKSIEWNVGQTKQTDQTNEPRYKVLYEPLNKRTNEKSFQEADYYI